MPDPSSALASAGCARHALVIAGLLAVALGIVVVRNGAGVSRLAADAVAMREGRAEAATLDSPEALLAWIRAHPERASIVVWEDSARVLAVAPEAVRPAPGLPVLLLGAEAARREASLALDSLTVPALAGDRAAADALLRALGRPAAEAVPDRLGVPDLDAPVPLDGLLLAWSEQAGGDVEAVPHAAWRDLAFVRDARLLADDPNGTVDGGRRGGLGLSLDQQRSAASVGMPRGTAEGYARLLRQALAGDSGGGGRFRRALAEAAPTGLPEGVFLRRGGMQGHLAVAGYATPEAGPARVVVLLLGDLPHAVYGRLTEGALDAGLVLGLLLGEVTVGA